MDFWTAVGSIGTSIAALIALGALVVTIILSFHDRREEQAKEIRRDIRAFAGALTDVTRLLEDGSPIIGAAWYAMLHLKRLVSEHSSAKDCRRLLARPGVGLSIAVAGWGEAPEAAQMRAAAREVARLGRQLTGNLQVLSLAGDMAQDIVDDVVVTFIKLLAQEDLLTKFLDDNERIERDELMASLSTYLHGTTAGYTEVRYSAAAKTIDDLVKVIADDLYKCSAAGLIAISRTVPTPPPEATRTGSMRSALTAIGEKLSPVTRANASRQIEQIEHAISKDTASRRLVQNRAGSSPD